MPETRMSIPTATEKRLLTADEFDTVAKSHHPAVEALEKAELIALIRRLREFRDRSTDIARQQRREMRGKADPRGARPAADNTGTTMKKQIFAQALKRANRELARLLDAEKRPTMGEIGRRALELKRANARAPHHPGGRSAGQGMRATPSRRRTVTMDPREVGRVTAQTARHQAKRDA
jgi:hypothetical protein